MSVALAQRNHSWDNRAKERLEKSGLKVNKNGEGDCARVPQIVIITMILATTCGRKHKLLHYTTQEDRPND